MFLIGGAIFVAYQSSKRKTKSISGGGFTLKTVNGKDSCFTDKGEAKPLSACQHLIDARLLEGEVPGLSGYVLV